MLLPLDDVVKPLKKNGAQKDGCAAMIKRREKQSIALMNVLENRVKVRFMEIVLINIFTGETLNRKSRSHF